MRRGLGCLLLLFIALKCSFKIRDIWSLRSSWSKRNRSDQLYRFELTSFEDDWKAPNQLLSFSVSFLTAPPPPLIWTWYLYVWVCVCVWERGCVRVRERVCEGVWEGVCVCVWERERERERKRKRKRKKIFAVERERCSELKLGITKEFVICNFCRRWMKWKILALKARLT